MKYMLILLIAGTSFAVEKEYIRVPPPQDMEGIEYGTRKCKTVKGKKKCADWDSSATSETHMLSDRVEEIRKPVRIPPPVKVAVPYKVRVRVYRPFFIGGAMGRGLGDIKSNETATAADIAEKEQYIFQATAGWRFSYNWSLYGVWVPDREGYLAGMLWSFGEKRLR